MTSPISVYVPNLPYREDRRHSIDIQFNGKGIFCLHVVNAHDEKIGAWGLWQTFYTIVTTEAEKGSDFFIFCEDDHVFTSNYDERKFLQCILEAESLQADLLSGGMAVVKNPVLVTNNLFWVSSFNGMQFTVIFKRLYSRILNSKTIEGYTVDIHLSSLAKRKFVIFPYMSIQKEFGYSDVTLSNNEQGKVASFFRTTESQLAKLRHISDFYAKIPNDVVQMVFNTDITKCFISTYVINLKRREDRKRKIQQQFAGRREFSVTILEACEDINGAYSLWKSICKIVSLAKSAGEDYILICEDDHEFTKYYRKEIFLRQIMMASCMGAEIVNGGVGGFGNLVPVQYGLYWADWFWCTQFIVIYKDAYDKILRAHFGPRDTADGKLSEICTRKLVIAPFISEQQETGYSDVTSANNYGAMISRHFSESRRMLQHYFMATAIKQHHKTEFRETGCKIKDYLASGGIKALQLGCGKNMLSNWLNTDVAPWYGATFMDATQPFPIPDRSFNFVFAEHLFETLAPTSLENTLHECYRILADNGKIRIVVYSCENIVMNILQKPYSDDFAAYINWSSAWYGKDWTDSNLAQSNYWSGSLALSSFMRRMGTSIMYDTPTLTRMLIKSGFTDIQKRSIGYSPFKELSGIEMHETFIPKQFYKEEIIIIEASKNG